MNTDQSNLALMQLSDSFFPSGLYTMSNGLETLFDEKYVSSEGDVYNFLEVILYDHIHLMLCCGGLFFALRGNRAK